jgi:hypothetical protein
MTLTPKHLDPDFNREHDADKFQVVYLVKRPGYELVFAIPTRHAAFLSDAQAFLQVRFRGWHQDQALVLTREVLEDFHESLSRLMEYFHIEQQKSLSKQGVRQPHDVSPTHE